MTLRADWIVGQNYYGSRRYEFTIRNLDGSIQIARGLPLLFYVLIILAASISNRCRPIEPTAPPFVCCYPMRSFDVLSVRLGREVPAADMGQRL